MNVNNQPNKKQTQTKRIENQNKANKTNKTSNKQIQTKAIINANKQQQQTQNTR